MFTFRSSSSSSKMEVLYVIALLATGVVCEQMQIIGVKNGAKIPIDISLEGDFMMAQTGPRSDPPQPGYRPSLNFYDLHKHLEARKLSDGNICFIRPFFATYEQIRLLLEHAKLTENKETDHVKEEWIAEGAEILTDQLPGMVGEKITHFCDGAKVVWAVQEPVMKAELASAENQGRYQKGDERRPTALHKEKRSLTL